MTLRKRPFENIVGKKNAGNPYVPPPPWMFSIPFMKTSNLSSQNAFNLDKSTILLFDKSLTLYSIDTHFNASTTDSFENIVGKEEIARNEHFLLFPLCLLLNQKIVSPFVNTYDIISLFASELEEPKIGM